MLKQNKQMHEARGFLEESPRTCIRTFPRVFFARSVATTTNSNKEETLIFLEERKFNINIFKTTPESITSAKR